MAQRRLTADLDQLNYFLHVIGTASALLLYAVFRLDVGSNLVMSSIVQLSIILGCRAVPWFVILLLNTKLVGIWNVGRVSVDEASAKHYPTGGSIVDALQREERRGKCECHLIQAGLLRVKAHFTNLANAWCSKMEHFRLILLLYVLTVTGLVVRMLFDPMQAICAAPLDQSWRYIPCA